METKYAEIIDKGECFSTLDIVPNLNWKSDKIRKLACREEWNKYNFYPSNGLVGEIIDSFYNHFFNCQVYVLKIDKHYVPMSEKGIKFIAEIDKTNEYDRQ